MLYLCASFLITFVCFRLYFAKQGDTCCSMATACGSTLSFLFYNNGILGNGATCEKLQIGGGYCCTYWYTVWWAPQPNYDATLIFEIEIKSSFFAINFIEKIFWKYKICTTETLFLWFSEVTIKRGGENNIFSITYSSCLLENSHPFGMS